MTVSPETTRSQTSLKLSRRSMALMTRSMVQSFHYAYAGGNDPAENVSYHGCNFVRVLYLCQQVWSTGKKRLHGVFHIRPRLERLQGRLYSGRHERGQSTVPTPLPPVSNSAIWHSAALFRIMERSGFKMAGENVVARGRSQ